VFIQADLEAARSGISRIEEGQIPDSKTVLKSGWFFPLPFVAIIGGLFWLNYSPETSAFFGSLMVIVSSYVLGYKGKRLTVDLLLSHQGGREKGQVKNRVLTPKFQNQ